MQASQDKALNVRDPLEEEGEHDVPANGSAPAPDTAAPNSSADGFHREQQTTAKKSMQDLDSSGVQKMIDVNVNAGSAEQVCT